MWAERSLGATTSDDELLSWRSFGADASGACVCCWEWCVGMGTRTRRLHRVARADASEDTDDLAELIDRQAAVRSSRDISSNPDTSRLTYCQPHTTYSQQLTPASADTVLPRSTSPPRANRFDDESAPVITLRIERASERNPRPPPSHQHQQLARELPSTSEMVGITEVQPIEVSVLQANPKLLPQQNAYSRMESFPDDEKFGDGRLASMHESSPPRQLEPSELSNELDPYPPRLPIQLRQQRQPMTLSQLLAAHQDSPAYIDTNRHQSEERARDHQRIQQLEAELEELHTQVGTASS